MSCEMGSQISVGCPKRQRRGGIFNVLHAGCIDLFWNDPINHLVQCTVYYLKIKTSQMSRSKVAKYTAHKAKVQTDIIIR